MKKNCPKAEYLDINADILAFAEKILSAGEIEDAESLSLNLTKKSTRQTAQKILKNKLGCRPKRPIYYANAEIDRLPNWTRYPIEYMGHFVDVMVKCVTFEKTSEPRCQESAFGPNLRRLKGKIPEDLHLDLDTFNNIIYRPAKHDFTVENRTHRFTCKEVVFTVFITLNLKERLIGISNEVKDYCEDKSPY